MLCGMGERGKMAGILIIVSRLAAPQRWGDDDGTCEQSIKKLTYVPTCAHTAGRLTN